MDLMSYVSTIKIDADGLCASQAQITICFEISRNYAINKNTTTSYAPQR